MIAVWFMLAGSISWRLLASMMPLRWHQQSLGDAFVMINGFGIGGEIWQTYVTDVAPGWACCRCLFNFITARGSCSESVSMS
jgi:hypothetical protein